MKLSREKMMLTIVAIVLAAAVAISGCGGGGGGSTASSDTSATDDSAAKATISGTASIEGVDDCSDVVVVAEKVNDGVTRTVQKAMDAAASGQMSSGRVAAADEGVYMTATDDSCAYSLSVTPDTYSVSAYKEDTVGAQPRVVAARSAAVVTVNFELVATGKIAGTISIGVPGSDIVFAYLDGTSFVAFASSGGSYLMSNVPVGTYTIVFVREGTKWGSNSGVAVAAGATTNSALTSISIVCIEDEDCDDTDDYTADTCSNPGSTTSAACSYAAVACISDTDCDDAVTDTEDSCVDPYKASAYCVNALKVVGGTIISTDTTWGADVSPVTVTGQFTVASGATLTIDPGVELYFSYPADDGSIFPCCGNTSLSGIYVLGNLSAVGTAASPIYMGMDPDSKYAMPGYWEGIFFDSGSDGTVSYVNMQYTSSAIIMYYASPVVSNVNITDVGSQSGIVDSFHVYTKQQSGWQEAGVLHYALKVRTGNLDLSGLLPDADGEYKVRIEQVGATAAHIDSIKLSAGNTDFIPAAAFNTSTGQDVLYKISSQDMDLTDAYHMTFDVKFNVPAGYESTSKSLTLAAREENGEVQASGRAFSFPNNANRPMSQSRYYSYVMGSEQGSPVLDGDITRHDGYGEPVFAEWVNPNSGHPAGTVYGYAKNDAKYLYMTVDFTSDNTFDQDADYAAIHVKQGNSVKTFRLSVPETKYGRVGFTYTSAVDYQHKVYEFAIPLSEIGNPANGQAIEFVAEAYGTSSWNSSVIYAYYSNAVSISDVNIEVTSGYINGIVLEYLQTGPHTLSNISISNSGYYGLNVYSSPDISATNLSIEGTRSDYGMYLSYADNFLCSSCSITDTENGYSNVMTYYGDGITFTNTNLNNSTDYALNINSSTNMTITNSDLSYNSNSGIYAYNATNLIVSGSRMAENCSYGAYIYTGSVTISDSNLIDNSSYGVYGTSASLSLDGVYMEGNAGAGDGVVETSTAVPNSDVSYQYYGIAAMVSQALTANTVTEFAGTAPTCGGYY